MNEYDKRILEEAKAFVNDKFLWKFTINRTDDPKYCQLYNALHPLVVAVLNDP